MTEIFPQAVAFVLAHECGYSNDVGDPGGETNFGISKHAYPNINIKALTKDQAIEIYRRDYWAKIGCDYLAWPMDMIIFDTAVNCGVARAMAWTKEITNPMDYLARRLRYYASIKGSALYLRGWVYRVLDLYEAIKS
jgi:lysozyme family protein